MRIGDLRERLDIMEDAWDAEFEQYMGKFEDQEIVTPVFQWNRPGNWYAKDGAFEFKGYSGNNHLYWTVTGMLIFEDKETV